MLFRFPMIGLTALLPWLLVPTWSFAQIKVNGAVIQVEAIAAEVAAEDDDDDDEDRADVKQEISIEVKQDGKQITVTQSVEGNYAGEVIENGEATSIKAATLNELKEKFPAVHEVFTQKPANPLARPGAAQNVSVQVTDNNGDRKVVAQEPGRKVTLRDQQGKQIEITVKQDLEHGSRTERYEAPHLDALREKYPEMAQLYKQYRDGVIGFGGAVNLQVQAVPGRINNIAGHPGVLGPRKIVGEHNGDKVVIKDDNGRNIRISVTKTVDGKDETENYEAPDLATLKKQHKEIAAIYEKLAGKGLPQGQNRFGGIVIGNAGVPVQIQVQAQAVPAQAIPDKIVPVPDPNARAVGGNTDIDLKLARRQLEQSLQRLDRLANNPKYADAEAAAKLVEELTALAKKLEELETKSKK